MKLDPRFYADFLQFDFMLTYELDAYVFSDQLDYWCERGFDYIGAPWFVDYGNTGAKELWRVGNSGFSLRNVRACFQVLTSFTRLTPVKNLFGGMVSSLRGMDLRSAAKQFIQMAGIRNNTHWRLDKYQGNEDIFWTVVIGQTSRAMNVASIPDAIKFSFEMNPSMLFRMNNNTLPFGCHGWRKYEYDFWKSFIENQD